MDRTPSSTLDDLLGEEDAAAAAAAWDKDWNHLPPTVEEVAEVEVVVAAAVLVLPVDTLPPHHFVVECLENLFLLRPSSSLVPAVMALMAFHRRVALTPFALYLVIVDLRESNPWTDAEEVEAVSVNLVVVVVAAGEDISDHDFGTAVGPWILGSVYCLASGRRLWKRRVGVEVEEAILLWRSGDYRLGCIREGEEVVFVPHW